MEEKKKILRNATLKRVVLLLIGVGILIIAAIGGHIFPHPDVSFRSSLEWFLGSVLTSMSTFQLLVMRKKRTS